MYRCRLPGRYQALSCSLPLALVWFASVVFSMSAGAQSLGEYRLGTGDLVNIVVFDEPDLTLTARIGDVGMISYPFLGEVAISGLTVGQVEELITKRLKGPFLVDPKVTVAIVEYRQFYVNGEVVRPGGYSFLPGLSVRKAISIAGGLKEGT